jgi:hypothetical protein
VGGIWGTNGVCITSYASFILSYNWLKFMFFCMLVRAVETSLCRKIYPKQNKCPYYQISLVKKSQAIKTCPCITTSHIWQYFKIKFNKMRDYHATFQPFLIHFPKCFITHHFNVNLHVLLKWSIRNMLPDV